MTYSDAVAYLYQHLPLFSNVGEKALNKGLDNIQALCFELDNPHQKIKTIHIGGTNGKGSTSHLLASVLQCAGYKTGLYTSPHLIDFRERIKINGQMIPKERVVEFTLKNKATFETLKPSFFEMTAAMAFDYFAAEEVEVAIIEVGLGGRWDATNIITPLLSIITNISLDHVALLGNSLPEIATEKAGIIKPNVPVVVGEFHSETYPVFVKNAQDKNSPLYIASQEWKSSGVYSLSEGLAFDIYNQEQIFALKLDLEGGYQTVNACTVAMAVKMLKKHFKIGDDAFVSGMNHAKRNTDLKGRWQKIQTQPMVVLDIGHNEAGIKEIVRQTELTPHQELHVVLGMVKDKDVDKVLCYLPKEAHYYFCKAGIERALDKDVLCQKALQNHLLGRAYGSCLEAYQNALKEAKKDDLVLVCGSNFVVAEIVSFLEQKKS